MRLLLFTILLAFVSCNNSQSVDYSKKATQASLTKEHPGEALMKQLCYACHNATSSHDSRIAPPMIAVKKHYMDEDISQEEFTNDFVSFVMNPSEEKAKMRGAVRRFNIMPKQVFKKEDVEKIAAYIYENKIEEPTWFQQHWNERGNHGKGKGKMKGKKRNQKNEIGAQYAMKTKQQLAKNLIGTIQKEGTVAALRFCNTKAIPITDSMSVALKATIRRVSNKPRNSSNKATKEETRLIGMYQEKLDKKEEFTPSVIRMDNGKTQFYVPIVTNQMCLQCHGKSSKDIEKETILALKELYPKDKAIGYGINQVRGLWNIQYELDE